MSSSRRPSLREAPLPPRAVRRDPAEVFGTPGGAVPPPVLPVDTRPVATSDSPTSSPRRASRVEPVRTRLVRPKFLPKPRPKRADGRATKSYDIHPVLAGLVDEAAELLSDRMGRKLDKSAFYEALLAVALRRLEEVEGILLADPEGVAITANLVRELEARGGLLPAPPAYEESKSHVPTEAEQIGLRATAADHP